MSAIPFVAPASLRRNIAAGWASAAVSAVVGLAIVPIQLRLLGTEAYGLIGFCVTLQSILLLLDMGVSATVNREVARCISGEDLLRVAQLLGALEWVCWGVAAASAAGVAALAPAMAAGWLNVVDMKVGDVSDALMIAAVLIAMRWPIALYQSVLLGAQRVVLNSQINVIAVCISAASGIAVITWLAADVRWFLASQAACAVLQVAALAYAARVSLGASRGWKTDFGQIGRIWQFSAITGLVTVTGVCFMQMDKLLLSKLLTLRELGQYSLAAVLASGLYVVIMPVYNAVYPRFSRLLAAGEQTQLEELYRFSSQMLAALLAPIGVMFGLFSRDLVFAWTGDRALAADVAPVVSLLVAGAALHGLMFIPYALTLARGSAGLALKINLVLLALIGPMIAAGAIGWHAPGAAAAWLLLQLCYVTAGSYATHAVLLPHLRVSWLAQDVGMPVLGAIAVGVAAAQVSGDFEMHGSTRALFALVVLVACAAVTFISSCHLRIRARAWIART